MTTPSTTTTAAMAIARPPRRPMELVARSVEALSAVRTMSPPTSEVARAEALEGVLRGMVGTNGT